MSKIIGEKAEALFLAECINKDLIVSRPFGDNAPYDFVVDVDGKLVKVQVKSTTIFSECRKYRITCGHGSTTNNKKEPYSKKEVDFIAVYVFDYDAWYLIPIKKIKSVSVGLFPHIEGSKGQYEAYKGNWSALCNSK